MRNYYQIKTVASAPPKRQIQAGKVICVIGLIFTLCSPFIAWLLSVGVNRMPSFPLDNFRLALVFGWSPNYLDRFEAARSTS